MQLIKDLPARQLVTGITGHYVHVQEMTFGYVEIKANSDMAAHQHPHEQITYMIEGELVMLMNGKEHPLSAGMYFVIPSNTMHGAIAKTDCKLIDVFSPVREEYR